MNSEIFESSGLVLVIVSVSPLAENASSEWLHVTLFIRSFAMMVPFTPMIPMTTEPTFWTSPQIIPPQ